MLGNRLGLEVVHAACPWARAQMLVRQGQADGFVSVATDERLAFTVPTRESVTTGRLIMLARAQDPQRARLEAVQDAADLGGIAVGTYLGNDWAASVLQDLPVQRAPNREAGMAARAGAQ